MYREEFEDIRAYDDGDVKSYLEKYRNNEMLYKFVEYLYPDYSKKDIDNLLEDNVKVITDFTDIFLNDAVKKVIDNNIVSITYNEMSHIEDDVNYLYISNHRDIVLDTSLINYVLKKEGKIITQTAIGDNLLQNKFISDLARIMGCFVVKRNLSPKDSILASGVLSRYINFVLDKKIKSIWIAQKEGRTKDGNDKTNPAVLKMIYMANEDMEFREFFKKMKIIPVSISYEFDPTDYIKVPELIALDNNEKYIKEKDEDYISTLKGVLGYKGRVHIEFGKPIEKELDDMEESMPQNKKISKLVDVIDNFIHKNYKLREINYLAYDMMNKTDRFKHKYTEKDIKFLNNRIDRRTKESGVDKDVLEEYMLKIYGNPVTNKFSIE